MEFDSLFKLMGILIGFRCLSEPVDTTTPAGRMMKQMIEAFAEFERSCGKELLPVCLRRENGAESEVVPDV